MTALLGTDRPRLSRQRGLTLIEILGAIAVGASLMSLLSGVWGDLAKSQHAYNIQRYHQSVAQGAVRYIEANWAGLQSQMLPEGNESELRVTTQTLVDTGFLPQWWGHINPAGQTSCVMVRKHTLGPHTELQALLVTEGGSAIGIRDIWTAAGVSGHGVGILEQPLVNGQAGQVQASGYYGQWAYRFAPAGAPNLDRLTAVGCPDASAGGARRALQSGHLATWLSLRNPSQIAAGQSVQRRSASSNTYTTLLGVLGLGSWFSATADPTGTVLSTNLTGVPKEVDASCIVDEAGKGAADASGRVLVCGLTNDGKLTWQASGAVTLLDRLSAAQFAVMKVVQPSSSCNGHQLGELARVDDGTLAYCSREGVSHKPSSWKWRRVGGKWKYVTWEFTGNRGTVYDNNPIWLDGLPLTTRAVQLQIFMEPNVSTDVLTFKVDLPHGEIAKTCCGRNFTAPYLSMPPDLGTRYRIINETGGPYSNLWILPAGYIDDDPTP
jgi:hypothetical protein